MARKGGFQGGMGNMGNLMKQAQKMQRQMEEASRNLEEKEYKTINNEATPAQTQERPHFFN